MNLNIDSNTNLNNYKLGRNIDNKVAFKGAYVNSFMNLIANNDAFNAATADIFGMVLPRTYIDAKRNEHAKDETFRREVMGTITHCFLAGIVASGIALAAKPFMKVETNHYVNDDTMDLLKKSWDTAEGTGRDKTRKYVENVFNGIKGLDGEVWKSYSEEWKKLPEQTKNELGDPVERMVRLIHKENTASKKEELKKVENTIGAAIKSRSKIKVNIGEGSNTKTLETSLDFLVRDMRDMGEYVFTKFADNANGEAAESAISKLKNLNKAKTVGALGIVCVINLVVQHFNRKLTEKKTGKKGFVGYKDYDQTNVSNDDPNKKRKLLIKKGLAMLALAGLAKGTINFKNGIKGFQFQKLTPTMNQVKLLYTATVAGRFLSAEDDNEFRESCTRDFFSFVNWLVLGNVVTKAIATKAGNNLINYDKTKLKKDPKDLNKLERFSNWINNMSVKTHDEVLDINAGKMTSEIQKKTKTLNVAIGAGLLYSIVMLGFGIPILNMYLTNKRRAEELAAKQAKKEAVSK